MVVSLVAALASDARPHQTLLVAQQRQEPKDNRHVAVQLHAHEPVADRVSDVLEMHRLALDEHADGNDCIEGRLQRRRRGLGRRFGAEVRHGA